MDKRRELSIEPEISSRRSCWDLRAACKGVDTEAFYPGAGSSAHIQELKEKFCSVCPVVAECLRADIEQGGEMHGIWGGMSKPERDKLIKKLKKGEQLAVTLANGGRYTLEL